MKSVFLIKSPLQFLNAMEAQSRFGIAPEDSCFILMGDRKNEHQLKRLASYEKRAEMMISLGLTGLFSKSTISHSGNSSSRFLNARRSLFRNELFAIWKLRRIAGFIKRAEYVFIGDYGNLLMRHFINCLSHQRTILIDDGSATLRYCRQRWGGQSPESSKSKKIKLSLKIVFLGLRPSEPKRVSFFSVYPLKVPFRDNYIKNDFAGLRCRIQNKIESVDQVYFLGGTLTESKILSESEYFWHLKKVQKYFATKNLIYVAHRREKPQKLSRIESDLGISVRCFELPIEYQLAVVGPKPAVLASFVSSALGTCQEIFQHSLPIVSFRLQSSHFENENTAVGFEIDKVYENYERMSDEFFKVIKFL